jgi:hypothetical protein
VNGNRTMALLFLLLIFGVAVMAAYTPDRAFSQRENRSLAQLPPLSWKSLFSGQFMQRFEQYVDDQFPGRDHWVFLKTDLERLFGKRENNGIYFGADQFLLARYRSDASWLSRNAAAVGDFARHIGVPVSLLLPPTATAIYPEKLPQKAPSDDQQADWQQVVEQLGPEVHPIDVLAALLVVKDESIYFRTDHHWTMRGAYYAYAAWMHSRGEVPLSLEDLNSQIVSQEFWGTHYSKANLRQISPDQIELLAPSTGAAVSVNYPGEGLTTDSLYRSEFLQGRDQYAYFLGGNYPLVQISTDSASDRRILLIKDSYAHVFVPFLIPHYQEIHVMDLRYYAASAEQYVKQHGIDEVLFLYSLQQFADNAGLAKLVD